MKEVAIVIIIFFALFVAAMQTCHGYEISVGYGQDVPVASWQSEGLKCSVLQVKISQNVNSWLYGSLVLDRLEGKLDFPQAIDGKHFSGTINGLALSSRLGIQKYLNRQICVRLFGGLGILPQAMPEIGNSGIVGHFGVGVKYITTNWQIGYKIAHMSDPLRHGDKGWNWQLLTIGWRF